MTKYEIIRSTILAMNGAR
jgi:hypothetical protein